MDANFRLRLKKQKAKRSDNDPELGSGWMYMVNEPNYQATLAEHARLYPNQADVSSYLQSVLASS
jgi:hypothetical protein